MGFPTMKRIAPLATALISALCVAPASAAPRTAAQTAAVAPYNWTGCYLGGNAGLIRGDTSLRQYPSGLSINTGFQIDRDARTAISDFDSSDFSGGVQIGCNWQSQAWVLGVETDFNWTGLSEAGSVNFPAMLLPSNPAATLIALNTSLTHELPWFGTLRGRLGYAVDRVLVFATGGLAYGKVESTYHNAFTSGGTLNAGWGSDTRMGWTLGGGVEVAFADRWTVKAEYLYIDLGTFSYTAVNAPTPAFTWGVDVNTRAQIARVGLNYRF
jgi:outer membrane immunogenic protein